MGKQVPTFRQDELERLIAAIYASAAGEISWNESLDCLAQTFGATRSLLYISGKSMFETQSLRTVGEFNVVPEEYYQSELFRNDPRSQLTVQVPHGRVYYDQMLYDLAEMDKNSLYRQNTATVGVKYSLGVKLALPNGGTAALVVLTDEKEGHASVASIDAFQRLVPHIERALSISFMAEVETLTRSALLDALAHKADGVILLGANGTPTFLNDQAAAILQLRDGLWLSEGQMTASRAPEAKKLSTLIAQAICPALNGHPGCGGQMLVNRPSRKLPYLLNISSAPRTERFLTAQRIAAVIQVNDLAAHPPVSKVSICGTFGLSDREGDLAVELVQLNDLEVAAAAAGMAFNTARNHLHSMFRKLDVHHQADLMRMLGRAF